MGLDLIKPSQNECLLTKTNYNLCASTQEQPLKCKLKKCIIVFCKMYSNVDSDFIFQGRHSTYMYKVIHIYIFKTEISDTDFEIRENM